jgi:hypothetical protein
MPRLVARLFVRDPDELPDADQEYRYFVEAGKRA